MKLWHHVIIGSGPAGIFAAEAIRDRDPESSITMLTAESSPAHSPVMLTYWMGGEVGRGALFFRDPSWGERRKIDVRLNTKVKSLHSTSQELKLEDGRVISYDRLLIATGAIPIALSFPRMGSKGVTALRTLADAEAVLESKSIIGKVVIIGGGFIGLKLACHLREKGLQVTILEKEPKLASRIFDLKASTLVARKMREKGIRVETDVEVVEALNEQGWVTGVRLQDGRMFSGQRVIQAVGVRPNTKFLEGSGIELRGGIVVNERMETNIPGIYAAGDATVTIDSITLERTHNATWAAATRQGMVAGRNMAGESRRYTHNFALNALNLFGLRVLSAGHSYYEKQSGLDLLFRETNEVYRKIVIKDRRLIGFILGGDVSGTGVLLRLMRKQERISGDPVDLLSGPISQEDQLPPHLGYEHGFLFQNLKRKSIAKE
ncbi:MAG: FAD-dependent oxidoreductase [Deltaproteobacteria bacterium]|nr:FAD-dependent oxidoreductase [Deltaproteobacteria bacterium]